MSSTETLRYNEGDETTSDKVARGKRGRTKGTAALLDMGGDWGVRLIQADFKRGTGDSKGKVRSITCMGGFIR